MKHVLLVEDQIGVSGFIEKVLNKAGYQVTKSITGSQALRVLATHHVDLILSDINLPDMNGIQLLRRAADTGVSLPPCLGISICTDSDVLEDAKRAGMIRVLRKPVDILELIDACDSASERLPMPQIPTPAAVDLRVLERTRAQTSSDAVADLVDNALQDMQRNINTLARIVSKDIDQARWFYLTDAIAGSAACLGAMLLTQTARNASQFSLIEITLNGKNCIDQLQILLDDVADVLKEIPYLSLSTRERAVIRAVAEGLNNAEIAQLLQIKRRTVVFHLQRIARKLNTRGRLQTVIQAMKTSAL